MGRGDLALCCCRCSQLGHMHEVRGGGGVRMTCCAVSQVRPNTGSNPPTCRSARGVCGSMEEGRFCARVGSRGDASPPST